MKASVGDRIVVASNHTDRPAREGQVVAVRHPDGTPPYDVKWADSGEVAVVFPGSDAHIVPAPAPDEPESPSAV